MTKQQGGKPRPVNVITPSDLRENGGSYHLLSRTVLTVNSIDPTADKKGGQAINVIPVTLAQIQAGEYKWGGGSSIPMGDTDFLTASSQPAAVGGLGAYPIYVTNGLVIPASYQKRVLSTRFDNLIAHWPLNEGSGIVANDLVGNTGVGVNAVTNGNFEALASPFDDWTNRVSDGAIADETVIVHGGSHSLRLTAGASVDTWVTQDISVQPGSRGDLVIWVRGDGTYSGRYAILNQSVGGFITPLTSLNVTAATWTEKTIALSIPADCSEIRLYIACPATNTGIAYFDDIVLFAGQTQNLNGFYASSGVTYDQEGIGDGGGAPEFDGADTHVLIGRDAFNSLFNSARGSAVMWGRVDQASRWTDATTFRYLFHAKAENDPNIYIVFGKNQTNHQLVWRRSGGVGDIYEQTHTFSPSGPTTWFCMGFTWDITNTHFKGAITLDGVWSKIFDDGAAGIGLTDWSLVTNPANGISTVLMAGSTSAQEWIGAGARCTVWAGCVLSDAEMESVMVVPSPSLP
jgi:hypothetical protein